MTPTYRTAAAREHYEERLAICLEAGVPEPRAREIAKREADQVEGATR